MKLLPARADDIKAETGVKKYNSISYNDEGLICAYKIPGIGEK